MMPTIQNHRMTVSAWQAAPLAQSCDPPGSTSPPDKKIEQSERIARDRSRVLAVALA
jgi:hypothetical protein